MLSFLLLLSIFSKLRQPLFRLSMLMGLCQKLPWYGRQGTIYAKSGKGVTHYTYTLEADKYIQKRISSTFS